jgi:hypothetical protein
MPENLNQQYADAALIRSIDLQALATHMLIPLIERLQTLQREIRAAVAFYEPKESDTDAIVSAASEKIRAAYAEIERRLTEDFEQMAGIAAEKERDDLLAIFGVEIDAVTGAAILGGLVIAGLSLSELVRRQMGDLEFRTVAVIRRGVQNQDSLGELIDRLEGRSAAELTLTPVIEPSQRAIEQATRTATEAVHERARELSVIQAEEVAEEAADTSQPAKKFLRYGWQSIAVLDTRTTTLCRQYHGKIWSKDHKPIGHDLPWFEIPRHPYCRSTHVVVILDENPAKDETFAQWMARRSEAEQEKIFGKRALGLWKRGVISDSDLIRSRERQLTFDDLKKRT